MEPKARKPTLPLVLATLPSTPLAIVVLVMLLITNDIETNGSKTCNRSILTLRREAYDNLAVALIAIQSAHAITPNPAITFGGFVC